jgi:hypothetical protein
VYFLVALLAQKNMIQQPKQHYTGATDFSIFFTPINSELNNHELLAIFWYNLVKILDNVLSLTLTN